MEKRIVSQLPHPIPLSPWRQLLNWITNPLGFQDTWKQQYGDVFTMQLPGLGPMVVIGDPQMIRDIFSQDPKQFNFTEGNKLAEPLLGKNSLVLMEGDRHRRERKLLMPPFHGDRLQGYAQQICDITQQAINQWQPGQVFVARTAMQQISLEVILQIVFGLREGNRYQQIKPLMTAWANLTDSPLRSSILFLPFLQKDWGWTPWGQMKRKQRQIHDLLQAEIDARRTSEAALSTDILGLLMAARDEAGQAMTDAELKDELVTMLFAGHETTASTLAWALYQVHRQPEVRAKLLAELDSLGNSPNLMAVAQLPYLNAVCQETLRLYPVIPGLFTRFVRSPVQIGDYTFEAGTALLPSIHLVHQREELYSEPRQFRPERFLQQQYSPFEYFPFGGGNRRCLGYALAQLEMKLVLATLLSQVELTLAEDKPIPVQRRGFTLAPTGGVRMRMMARRWDNSQDKGQRYSYAGKL